MVNTHGLATSIRTAQESETFDLAGQNVTTITNTIQSAFQEPFDHANFEKEPGGMIRLTFVTGAGKQARAKYDDGAALAVTSTLTALGYVEDRGASCVLDCAGTYKQQHDTGKNLKTVVVFPKVNLNVANELNTASSSAGRIVDSNSPGYKLATAPMSIFENMVASKCPSWSEKRNCLTALEALQNFSKVLEEKLMQGTPLDESEQQFYDEVEKLDDKVSHVKQVMHDQVDRGDLTQLEKDRLVEQVKDRITQLKTDGKPTAKATQRQSFLQEIKPVQPRPLLNAAKIVQLKRELAPLLQLEASVKGRLLTLKETQTLSQKDDILKEIATLEEASKGWFEDDETFGVRLKVFKNTVISKQKKPGKS